MQYHLDTIFWAYFGEYLKKDTSFSLRKINTENKQKINEVYDVAYLAIFQYKLTRNEVVSELEPQQYDSFANYVVENYATFYTYRNKQEIENSKFDLQNAEHVELIKEILIKLVLVHMSKTSVIDSNEAYSYNYYWLNSSLFSLAVKFQYDLSFSLESDHLYHSVVYPFLATCAMIDIFDPKNMFKKIKSVFSKQNIALAFKSGRQLSADEKKWILADLTLLKHDSDWSSFLLNFSQDNWESFDIHRRFKLLHQLSKLTTLFLKENIKNISFIHEGDEVWNLICNYLVIFLPLNKQERQKEYKNHTNLELSAFFPSNTRDYNAKWTYQHSTKFREYKKNNFTEENIFNFIYRLKYALDYLDFITRNKNHNEIIATQLISFKSPGLVDTLKIYQFEHDHYHQLHSTFNFDNINLDYKKFANMLQDAERFEEIANPSSQMAIMLRALTLLVCIDYNAPKFFNYALSELIKYYVIVFGPYRKNTLLFNMSDIETLDAKVTKLLIQYEKLKNKELVLDRLGVLYKLQNFNY